MKKIILLCVMCGLLNSCAVAKDETLTFPDGRKYVGQVKDGIPNGHGIMTSLGDDEYVGQWKDGKYHGQGTIKYYYDGEYFGQYEGQWKDGERHGQGTYTWEDGRKYTGEWKDGKEHGQGILYDSNGKVIQKGTFENGEYVGE